MRDWGRTKDKPPTIRRLRHTVLALNIEHWQILATCFSFLNIGIANFGQCKILAGLSRRTWKFLLNIWQVRCFNDVFVVWQASNMWICVMLHSIVTGRHLNHSRPLTSCYIHTWSTQAFNCSPCCAQWEMLWIERIFVVKSLEFFDQGMKKTLDSTPKTGGNPMFSASMVLSGLRPHSIV